MFQKLLNKFLVLSTLFASYGMASSEGQEKQFDGKEIIEHLDEKITGDSSTLNSMFYVNIVKNKNVAELRTWEENPEESKVVSRFQVAFGKSEGDKVKQGDNKTPEGIYFSRNHIKSGLPKEKYGPYAIPVDFPNPIDKMEGKTGYGIWLHGAGDDDRIVKRNVTEGCVAFYNEDILKVKNWVRPYQAAVVISNDNSNVNKKEDIASVRSNLDVWAKSWAAKDLDGYISFYHRDFMDGRKNLSSYSRYKSRVFDSYLKMNVELSKVKVLVHEKYAVTAFNQYFNGDNRYIAKGSKILYWLKVGEDWKIAREVFSNREFQAISFNRESIASLISNQRVASQNLNNSKNDSENSNL